MRISSISMRLIMLAVLTVGLSACSGYDTDVPPPPTKAKLSEVFPAEVNGAKAKVTRLKMDPKFFQGFKASYGASSISAIKSGSKKSVSAWFKEKIVPVVDGYTAAVRAPRYRELFRALAAHAG